MKYRCTILLVAIVVLGLSGCFKVGTIEYTAHHADLAQPTGEARLIPATAAVMRVNGEAVEFSRLKRLANVFLNIGLMYLEPQVVIKAGENKVSARVSTSNSFSTGYYQYTTTYWRDYELIFNAEAGKEYALYGNYYGGSVWIEDRATKTRVSK